MNVVVCLKHVPDPREPWRYEPERHTLVRDSAEGMLDPLCDHALEAVLRWRDAGLDVTCWALAMGPGSARDTLKRALAKGADHAVWLQDPALAGSDLLASARALSAAIRRLEDVSLVLMGDRSLDAACGALGPMVAEALGWPYLGGASALEAGEGTLTAERPAGRAIERMLCALPAVVGVGRLPGEPRLPTFTGIMGTSKKELVTWSLAELGLAPADVGTAGSRTRVLALAPSSPRSARPLAASDPELASALMESLHGLGGRP